MLKRQILLLGLLEEFAGELSQTDMMKYLFLVTRYQDNRSYHFIPYKYGCFSFNAYSDKRKLMEKGILRDSEEWVLSENQGLFGLMLANDDRILIKKVKKEFGHLRRDNLIRHVYLNYPYYAINSEIMADVLSVAEIAKVKSYRPQSDTRAIYTIGYEGRTIEEYINSLIKEDVKVSCDVRRNPVSRKYGFSKKTMEKALGNVGIEYRHVPELGITGDRRRNLYNLEDYSRLFDAYEKEILSNCRRLLEMIYQLLLSNERVALTCFETEPARCHRTCVAGAVATLFDQDLSIIEL